MTRNVIDWLIIALLVTIGISAFIILWPACTPPVEAQPQESDQDEIDALHLARLCVNEAGWSVRECGAVWQVLRNTRVRGETLLQTMERHTNGRISVVCGPGRNGQTDRAWTRGLHLGDEPPHCWPGHLDWNEYRERFARMLEQARRFTRGELRGPCAGFPIAWGGAMDDWLAVRRGLVQVSCGDTRNRYWERP